MRALIFSLLILKVVAFPSGAGSCTEPTISMGPLTNFKTNNGDYTFTLPQTFVPGLPISVTITGAVPFKGFIIYAQDSSGQRLGSFSNFDASLIKAKPCTGDTTSSSTLTHTSSVLKSSVSLTWNAPPVAGSAVTFTGVVVRDIDNWFRVAIVSNPSSTAPPPAPTPTPSGSPAPSSSNDCVTFCTQMLSVCPTQYLDIDVCLSYCAAFPSGSVSAFNIDTFQCRSYHLGVAASDVASGTDVLHCPHTGPSGGGACSLNRCPAYCRDYKRICGATGAGPTLSDAQCAALCPSWATTGEDSILTTSGATIQCRNYHLQVASTSTQAAAVHCDHASYTGGNGVCGSLCEAFCDAAISICPTQYPTRSACLTTCAGFDTSGKIGDTTGGTLQCRFYHLTVASESTTNAATHCPHAAVDGGGICVGGCGPFCTAIATTCSSFNVYPSPASCAAHCPTLAAGGSNDIAGNSLSCRLYHVGVAATDIPSGTDATHCPHAGFSGGNACGSWCDSFCTDNLKVCTGTNQQFASKDLCMEACQTWNNTAPVGITFGASVQCRSYHLSVAIESTTNANTHCPHTGPLPTGVCGSNCESYCSIYLSACPLQTDYTGYADCLMNCGLITNQGTAGDTSGNTVGCRHYHAQVAALTGDTIHCEHASLSGGLVCSTACQDYCSQIESTCTGTNDQYSTVPDCVNRCQRFTFGTPGETSGDTFSCRSYHLGVASFNTSTANTHCVHAGATGGNVCGTLCDVYCKEIGDVCIGANQQFSTQSCPAVCASYSGGTANSYSAVTAGSNIDCRNYHLSVAGQSSTNADTHCIHAGAYGGGQCGISTVNFCSLLKTTCPTEYADFGGDAFCVDYAVSLASGTPSDTDGNTLGCRQYHLLVAASSSDSTTKALHCGHASYNKSTTCVPKPDCNSYCTKIMSTCPSQYTDNASCQRACAMWVLGDPSDTGVNTLYCRNYHLGVAVTDPATHCEHAGPTGGGACGSYCENYCSQIGNVCSGANTQYPSGYADCLKLCEAFPLSSPTDITNTAGDSIQCRFYHLSVAASSSTNAVTHCPHAGLTGGGACGTTLCESYCDLMELTCTSKYTTKAACLTACAAFPTTGTDGDTSGDTVQCRIYHAGVATTTGDLTHCNHADSTGGGVCVIDSSASTCTNVISVNVAAKTTASLQSGKGYFQGYTLNGFESPFVCVPPGQCVAFQVASSCFHPFYLTTDSTGGLGTDPNALTTADGISGTNSACAGTTLLFTPPAEGTYYYQCEFHQFMGNAITVSANCPNILDTVAPTSSSASGTTSAGTTAGTTAGTSAGTTAGTSAGTTAGTSAGTSAGTTAGTSAGTTAGTSAGTTAGGNGGSSSTPTTDATSLAFVAALLLA